MNRIILTESEKVSDHIFEITSAQKLNHLREILDISLGDTLKACELEHGLGEAVITELTNQKVTLHYQYSRDGIISQVHLFLAASRPPTCKKILEHGTSMGLASINFFNAILSEKSYLDSKLFKNEKFREHTQLGISQSAVFFQDPKVTTSKTVPFNLVEERQQKFILSLNTNKTFQDYKINKNLPIALSIGPERGWVKDEESCFEQLGFLPVKVSRSVLRVEQATFSALAQIEMLLAT